MYLNFRKILKMMVFSFNKIKWKIYIRNKKIKKINNKIILQKIKIKIKK
jgi:hypothetical protein